MGLLDVIKSELDRQRDQRKSENEMEEIWVQHTLRVLLDMRQSYDRNYGRAAHGQGTNIDYDRLRAKMHDTADALEWLLYQPEREMLTEEHIEEIESIIDQARVLGDRHPTHGREQARIGSELREDVVDILEIMDSKYP